MKFSKFNRDNEQYDYYRSNTFPGLRFHESNNPFGFKNFTDFEIIPGTDSVFSGRGKVPKGVVLPDFTTNESDPLMELFGFVAKVWIAGKIIGRW